MRKRVVRGVLCLGCVLSIGMAASTRSWANVLVNPGFETDAGIGNPPTTALTGWSKSNPTTGVLTSSNPDPTHSGIGSLQLTGPGNGVQVPVAYQTFAASPGQTWDFQGYMLVTNQLGSISSGLIKIVWENASGQVLSPGPAIIGNAITNVLTLGIEATPYINNSSAPNTWIFTEAEGVAPTNTAFVQFLAINLDLNPGTTKIWFDDLNATLVPEPSSVALVLMGLFGLAGFVGRRVKA